MEHIAGCLCNVSPSLVKSGLCHITHQNILSSAAVLKFPLLKLRASWNTAGEPVVLCILTWRKLYFFFLITVRFIRVEHLSFYLLNPIFIYVFVLLSF